MVSKFISFNIFLMGAVDMKSTLNYYVKFSNVIIVKDNLYIHLNERNLFWKGRAKNNHS